jgi:hypothetical protein
MSLLLSRFSEMPKGWKKTDCFPSGVFKIQKTTLLRTKRANYIFERGACKTIEINTVIRNGYENAYWKSSR